MGPLKAAKARNCAYVMLPEADKHSYQITLFGPIGADVRDVAILGTDMPLCIGQCLARGATGVWRAGNVTTLGYLAHLYLRRLD